MQMIERGSGRDGCGGDGGGGVSSQTSTVNAFRNSTIAHFYLYINNSYNDFSSLQVFYSCFFLLSIFGIAFISPQTQSSCFSFSCCCSSVQ